MSMRAFENWIGGCQLTQKGHCLLYEYDHDGEHWEVCGFYFDPAYQELEFKENACSTNTIKLLRICFTS